MSRARVLRAFGMGLLAVSLTGCIKMDMDLELNSDDTVDGTIIVALNKQASDVAESMGEDPQALLDELDTGDLPEDTEVEDYEDDEFTGQQYVFDGADLSEFSTDEDGFGIAHEEDEFVVSGEMDMSDIDPSQFEDMQDLPPEVEEQLGEDAADIDVQEMMDSFDLSVSVTFPGDVTDHNGELDGNTVTWTPEPGENLEIEARGADSDSGGVPVWVWILIAVIVVAGLAVLLFFLSRGRSQKEEPVAAGSVPPPPTDGMPSSSAETPMHTAEAAATQVPLGDEPGTHGTPVDAEDGDAHGATAAPVADDAGRSEATPPPPSPEQEPGPASDDEPDGEGRSGNVS